LTTTFVNPLGGAGAVGTGMLTVRECVVDVVEIDVVDVDEAVVVVVVVVAASDIVGLSMETLATLEVMVKTPDTPSWPPATGGSVVPNAPPQSVSTPV
jgi:hypothetical protein